MKQLRESLQYILSKGFNPYEDNSSLEKFIEELLLNKKDINKIIPIINISHSEKEALKKQQSFYSIKYAFDLALDISTINKKLVIQYLNTVLQSTSPRNRNNTRTDISSLFQTLEDNEVIKAELFKELNSKGY